MTARLKLPQLIIDRFNLEEFRRLCFALDIKYDLLRGEELLGKTVSLLEKVEKQNRLPELLQMLKKLRPDENWPDPAEFKSTVTVQNHAYDDPVRSATWNALQKSLFKKKTFLNQHRAQKPLIHDFSFALWADHFNKSVNLLPKEPGAILEEIHHRYFSCRDQDFIALLEFILNYWNDKQHYKAALINQAVNRAFETVGSSLQYQTETYQPTTRFKSGCIVDTAK